MALGPKEDRLLITGLHTVADIYCTTCNTVLGWKYVSAAGAGWRARATSRSVQQQQP